MLGLNKKRKNLLELWHETEEVLKKDILCRQSIEDSRERTIFYPETDVIYPNMKEKTGNKVPKNVIVSEWDTFTAASKLSYKYDEKIAVLNFANAYHPGGGVTIGARAKEEDLCRVSTLYPVLATKENIKRYYGRHSKNFTAYRTLMISYAHYFDVIEFAVYCTDEDKRNYRIFKEVLSR